ncbi:hypothetical protein [Antarcticirhabdus aurantiaca]|uniref:Uncharacterized protein n=1 Tax=Antarcticirhabdus aurantiaca TaxID=2606717 RepID=A0ACD4NQI2_9HYPH|nr:hypothetical protein [Antarcticirhabdus aurantiaca]WAJ29012.1 hypothetical protein OXU80_01815 [Jeongeuplla avenae]
MARKALIGGTRRHSASRIAVLALALAAGIGAGAPAVAAERLPSTPGTDAGAGLAGSLLTYSPTIFDLTVQFARSFVGVTYGSRAYDPVTKRFVARDLRLERGGVVVEIGRWSVGATTQAFDAVSLDTRALPLDEETRAMLRELDIETLRGSVLVAATVDEPSASFDVDVTLDLPNLGRLDAAIGIDGFHILVPLAEATVEADGTVVEPRPEILGRLRFFEASFEDRGLVEAGIAAAARENAMTPDAMRGFAGMMAATMPQHLLVGRPGADDPKVVRQSGEWSAALQRFIAEPNRIFIGLDPEEPVELAALRNEAMTAETILSLRPSVVDGPPPATPLLAPGALALDLDAPAAERLALAERLIAGRGAPQDAAAGLALVRAEALAGDPAAVRLAGQALGVDPSIALDPDEAQGLYVALASVPAVPGVSAGIEVLRGRLGPAELAQAEVEAGNRFAGTPDGAAWVERLNAAVRGRDFAALRQEAFDAYEGRGRPRDLTQAFALASAAAAGGDGLAAGLRDDIARAAREGSLALDLGAARESARLLWADLLDEDGAAGPPAGGPASPN